LSQFCLLLSDELDLWIVRCTVTWYC
jgi:hypothetical protein